MACQQCQNAGIPCHYPNIPSCNQLIPTKGTKYDAECIFYTGAPLTCTGIASNTSLETILQVFDSKICNSNGTDFSTYDLKCLDENTVIETEQEWVEAVSEEICNLKDAVANLPESVEEISELQTQVESIVQPNLTLPPINNSSSSSSLNDILIGLGNATNTLNNNQSLTSVNWDYVYTTSQNPATPAEGFTEILGQMLLLKNQALAAQALPTYNTNGFCVAHQGASTPLNTVINDLLLKTCEAPSWFPNLVSRGCVDTLDDSNSLTSYLGGLFNSVNELYSERKIFNSEHFIVEPSDACSESLVSLRPELLTGGKVSLEEGDTAGFLSDKIQMGTNIQADYVTEPGKVIFNVNVTDAGTLKVASGGSAGFLVDKVIGSSASGVTISLSNVSDQLKINVSINTSSLAAALAEEILTYIADTPERTTQFCSLVDSCTP